MLQCRFKHSKQHHALKSALGLASITMDKICQAQTDDDSLQPVIQLLKDQDKPPHSSLHHYPEDMHVLLSQWDSMLHHEDVFHCRFHYLDGTTNFLQIILPAKLHQSHIERLHADLAILGGLRLATQSLTTTSDFQGGVLSQRLQEAATFVQVATGKQMQRMKRYYDVSVKPQRFEEGDQVLLFDPQKKREHYAKWHVSWKGPMIDKKQMDDTNYVLQKSTKCRPFAVHVERVVFL